jgi:hypothetical protein
LLYFFNLNHLWIQTAVLRSVLDVLCSWRQLNCLGCFQIEKSRDYC